MKDNNFGDTLQLLRQEKGFSQKEFAEFLEIPQPTISGYENGRNSPSMEVLINIAQKCNVSVDWLCDISSSRNNISTMGDVADFFYKLMELKEIGLEIEIYNLSDDLRTEGEGDYACCSANIKVSGTDPRYIKNEDLFGLIKKLKEDYRELESHMISKENFDIIKSKRLENYYRTPLTVKEFPKLSDEEILERRYAYIKSMKENR